MPRIARFLRSDVPSIYHVISRTALSGFPLDASEKNYLLNLIRKLSRFYFADVLGFCVMSNHFHLVVRMHPFDHLSDQSVSGEPGRQTGLGHAKDYVRMQWMMLQQEKRKRPSNPL
jgi:hypothetical protein